MDLASGSITTKIIKFSLPLMLGNLLQQMYNTPTHGWQTASGVRMQSFIDASQTEIIREGVRYLWI